MAYRNPTIESRQVLTDGSTQLTLRFTGDADEPTRECTFLLEVGMTAADVRRFVWRELSRLNALHAIKVVVEAVSGPIPPLAPSPPPAPTAKQIWCEKYARFLQHKDSGLGGAVADALTALKVDLESTYQDGFLNE